MISYQSEGRGKRHKWHDFFPSSLLSPFLHIMLSLVNDFKTIFVMTMFFVIILLLTKYVFGYTINTLIIHKNNCTRAQKTLLDMGTFSVWKIIKEHKEYMDGLIFCANRRHFFIGFMQGASGGSVGEGPSGSMMLQIFANKKTIELIQNSRVDGIDTDDSNDPNENNENKMEKMKKKKLVIFSRLGNNYAWLDYTKSYFDCRKRFEVREGSKQQAIVDDILDKIRTHQRLIQSNDSTSQEKDQINQKRPSNFFIHGSPGSGKSTIALIVANALNGSLCKDFTPTDPGDNLPNLIQSVEPTEASPLIICNDEADTMIYRAHNSLIPKHKNIPVAVYDKRSMNKFREDIEFCENVYYIETSNVPKSVIDSWDPSYLRDGRVDAFYEM